MEEFKDDLIDRIHSEVHDLQYDSDEEILPLPNKVNKNTILDHHRKTLGGVKSKVQSASEMRVKIWINQFVEECENINTFYRDKF